MKKGCCVIGEVLIDFIPNEKGKRLKDVNGFTKMAGGAPANVAGVVGKWGLKAKLLTQVGNDAFGDYLIDCLKASHVDTTLIKQSNDYDTSLAFVSLADDGNRDFKFYRRTAADLQFLSDDIPSDIFKDCSMMHFCSVDLVDSPMKEAHRRLIELAIDNHALISFDPNLRLSLWDDHHKLKATVLEFMRYADILKISDEELFFITGKESIEKALPDLLKDRCKVVIYTKGKDGVELFTKNMHLTVPGYTVDVVDTTGAGDSFIGAFITQLLENEVIDLNSVSADEYEKYLDFSNLYAAYVTTQKGALASLPDQETLQKFKDKVKKCEKTS